MHADQLRVAIDKVVDTLAASGIMTAIRDYRTAKGDQRPVAAARLGHAGAMLMERMGNVTPQEETALKIMHLNNLRDTGYWQALLSMQKSEQERNAELVHLYSRVMFASNHLPNFSALLGRVDTGAGSAASAASGSGASSSTGANGAAELQAGESRITIHLTDAGEKASDPDRIARSIDGIDMLYSACASLSRRPAMDLRLDYIAGAADRSIVFTGESDSLSAMAAIIDSIPEALADLNDDQEIDLDALVQSLPIFSELNTLTGHGAFSEKDLRDIRETMHQGALLTLESGVVLTEPPVQAAKASVASAPKSDVSAAGLAAAQTAPSSSESPVGRDEHYERYLKERAAMQNGSAHDMARGSNHSPDPFPTLGNAVDADEPLSEDNQAAVENLLKSLNQQRDG
jgi:hypothetical protein